MGVMIEGPCRSCRTVQTEYGVVEQPTYTMYYCLSCGRQQKIVRKTLQDTQREVSWLRRNLDKPGES